jgi:hypothetical protein
MKVSRVYRKRGCHSLRVSSSSAVLHRREQFTKIYVAIISLILLSSVCCFYNITVSTTVVNPSIWMPAYNESRWNAVFFVIFIVVSVFYLHSLVLSVVFQVFIQSATEIHRRSNSCKEESLQLAFLALTSTRNSTNTNINQLPPHNNALVDTRLICEMLRLLRPHYSQQKLNVLIDIILPPNFESSPEVNQRGIHLQKEPIKEVNTNNLNYDAFQKRIQHALSSSIRITRRHSTLGVAVEILSVVVAILNFVFVIIFTLLLQSNNKNDKIEFIIGSLLTVLTLLEVSIRYNPWQYSNRKNTINRLNAALDGMGCIGGIVSFIGT